VRAGRPFVVWSVGKIRLGDGRRVPDDAGGTLVVPGFDVADGVALGGQGDVVGVGVEVRGDGAVAELRHIQDPFDASARLLIAIGKDGPRDGSTSAKGGPEPRAGALRAEHGEDRTGAAAQRRRRRG
jgi:hypothetical protein